MIDLGIPGLDDIEEVGRGGFGVVYRARQTALDRNVAVKMLAMSLNDEASRARFSREGRAMGPVSGHPNVVVLYEYGLTGHGSPYLVLEYLPRGSLADRVASGGPLSIDEATSIVVGLAGALETAHRAGVLHRDVKPENVMLSQFGDAKLGDFGIARLDGTLTGTQGLAASPAHAPPELVEGGSATPQSDIYSLASTLYQLLAGKSAFVRDTDESMIPLLARLVREDPPDLAPIGVPADLQSVVFRAMAKSPADRPATALQFAEELNAARKAVGYAPAAIRVLDVASPSSGPALSAPFAARPSAPISSPPVSTPTPAPPAPPPAVEPPTAPVPAPVPPHPAPVGAATVGVSPLDAPSFAGPTPGAPVPPQYSTHTLTPPPPGPNASRAVWIVGGAVLLALVIIGVAFAATRGSQAPGTTEIAGPSSTTSTSSTTTRPPSTTTTEKKGSNPGDTVVPEGDVELGKVSVSGAPLASLPSSGRDSAVGKSAPKLEGEEFDSTPITVPGKGRPAVLMFIAHWCEHCQKNVKMVESYLDKNGSPDDVDLYAITTSTSSNQSNYPPSEWLRGEGWKVPTLVDDEVGTAGKAFGLTDFTFFVVLDADGKVVRRITGTLADETEFEDLVAQASG